MLHHRFSAILVMKIFPNLKGTKSTHASSASIYQPILKPLGRLSMVSDSQLHAFPVELLNSQLHADGAQYQFASPLASQPASGRDESDSLSPQSDGDMVRLIEMDFCRYGGFRRHACLRKQVSQLYSPPLPPPSSEREFHYTDII